MLAEYTVGKKGENCNLLETTPESALAIITAAGTIALPKFLKYFALTKESRLIYYQGINLRQY
jgi:hypothetical protein